MQTLSVGVFGASGFSGIELTRLLARHPHVTVKFLTSDRWVGQRVDARLGPLGALSAHPYVSHASGLELAKGCEVVLLATPSETSLELGGALFATQAKVIDLAGTFRLRDAALYPRFYGFTHSAPQALEAAVYGLPELFRAQVKGARFIANPGCYPTAAALSIAPLVAQGLVERETLVFNAASGVSGAGRKATEDYSFMELDGDFRAYKVLKHQHTPEIEQTLSTLAGVKVSTVFTPHLLPIKRGILNTTVGWLVPGVTEAQVSAAYAQAYGGEPLLQLAASADAVRLADVVGTPRAVIGVSVEGRRVVAISAIDNLLKGAASQAIQNLNLLGGFPETEGLL